MGMWEVIINKLVDTIVYHLRDIENEILTLRWTKLVIRKWAWHLKYENEAECAQNVVVSKCMV
jgi:hypothetical protein